MILILYIIILIQDFEINFSAKLNNELKNLNYISTPASIKFLREKSA